jgi:hypothetical protein
VRKRVCRGELVRIVRLVRTFLRKAKQAAGERRKRRPDRRKTGEPAHEKGAFSAYSAFSAHLFWAHGSSPERWKRKPSAASRLTNADPRRRPIGARTRRHFPLVLSRSFQISWLALKVPALFEIFLTIQWYRERYALSGVRTAKWYRMGFSRQTDDIPFASW